MNEANDLVINPFTQISFGIEEVCFLISPKPKFGLQTLTISKSDDPHLYDLFLDLSKIRLDFLDIENDLNNEERQLLFDYGVLVEADKVPNKPLFACQFDEIETIEFSSSISTLMVNPSFRFEPLNLGNFNSFAQGNNLLPYQPSVWVKPLVSEIEIGYWLNEAQKDVISNLKAGEKPSFEIEKELLGKLVSAEILISEKVIEQRKTKYFEQLKQVQNDFKQNKYAVLHNLLPPAQMKAMQNYYREYVSNGFMPFNDTQVKRRYYQHNEPLAKFLHSNLTKIMSLVAGEEVKPSYVYAASYEEDAVLNPHTDRPQCEFSFSFQVDYQPETEKHLSPWGLFLMKPDCEFNQEIGYSTEDFPAQSEGEDNNIAVYLTSGDALAYRGCELIHYRYALPKGHKSTSLFFHYVPIGFEGDLS